MIFRLFQKTKALLYRYKFVRDTFWNFSATFITAVSGILLNIIVGNEFGADGLGIFNKSFAYYSVFSILLSSGFSAGIVKFAAENAERTKVLSKVVVNGFLIAMLTSLTFSFVLFWAIRKWGLVWSVNEQAVMCYFVLGLPAFVVNKILAGYANGLRYMKFLSFMQSLRWILILGGIVVVGWRRGALSEVSFVFFIVEMALLVLFLSRFFSYINFSNLDFTHWAKKYFDFGVKVFISNSLNQANTKLDILVTSFFLTDTSLGVYSFASTLASGLLMVASPIQTNFNPIVSKLMVKKNISDLKQYICKVQKYSYVLITLISILMAVGYPVLVKFFMTDQEYESSYLIFYILLSGYTYRSYFFWSGGLLIMGGFPEDVVISVLLTTVLNLVVSLTLVFFFGIIGAAISAVIFNFSDIFIRDFLIKKRFGFRVAI